MNTRYSFLDDYSEGCHPSILDALVSSNKVQQNAYGHDEYSIKAKSLIQKQLGSPDIPVFFVSGGTLANIIIISSSLRSHEAVISAHTGHIVAHETGAIEATGHKIIPVNSTDGKLYPEQIEATLTCNAHFPHMARPRAVYISNATEIGTVYTKAELSALSTFCKANELLLIMDGARLGAALTATTNDMTLKDIANLTDIFWIGGTKAGALIGEAIVIPNLELTTDFEFHIKQRGALLAKGRLLGAQFQMLFKDGLFFKLSTHANTTAQRLSNAITNAGFTLSVKTDSNQVFPILPNTVIDELRTAFDFHSWGPLDNAHSIIRLVTSWATDEVQVELFCNMIKATSANARTK